MAGDNALRIAEAILADRRGADFYRNESNLAGLLEGQFAVSFELAIDAAILILEDRHGKDLYKDPAALADFLETHFGLAGDP